MVKEVVALQGKEFTVSLQSMVGSSGYGWYLSGMTEGIIFLYQENIPVRPGIAPVNQVFHFAAVTDGSVPSKLSFSLLRSWMPEETADFCAVNVRVVPHDGESFVPYSENTYSGGRNSSGAENINIKYGYRCGAEDANMKYGYRCGAEDVNVKYGYCCGAEDANMKYGYRCGAEDVNVKYGYRCGAEDANMKYGYRCGAEDAKMIYGFLCGAGDASKAAMPYGYWRNGGMGGEPQTENTNALYAYWGCR